MSTARLTVMAKGFQANPPACLNQQPPEVQGVGAGERRTEVESRWV